MCHIWSQVHGREVVESKWKTYDSGICIPCRSRTQHLGTVASQFKGCHASYRSPQFTLGWIFSWSLLVLETFHITKWFTNACWITAEAYIKQRYPCVLHRIYTVSYRLCHCLWCVEDPLLSSFSTRPESFSESVWGRVGRCVWSREKAEYVEGEESYSRVI